MGCQVWRWVARSDALQQVSVTRAPCLCRRINRNCHPPSKQLMLTKVRPGPLHETDLPAGVLLSTVVDSPVTR